MSDLSYWEKIQNQIDEGFIDIVFPDIVSYIKEQLTPDELNRLGDLSKMKPYFSDELVKKKVDFIIDMTQKGLMKEKDS